MHANRIPAFPPQTMSISYGGVWTDLGPIVNFVRAPTWPPCAPSVSFSCSLSTTLLLASHHILERY
jgi:hypothetical protein